MTKHIIVYSHGFGVRKDDRGLFTDIAKALPTFQHNMFDYSMHDDATNTLTVRSLDGQVIMLREVITRTRAENPTAVIDLVCHSQGCVVAALAKPQGLRKTIFIGAPAELSVDDMIRIFSARPGSEINRSGVSRLSRADFSTTLVPPEYWESIEILNP